MRLSATALLMASALLLPSCGGVGGEEGPVSSDERQLGADQHPQLLAEFGGAYEASEAKYVARVGEKLAAAAGLEGCHFTLVNTDVVNAFAVPGCYIYVTRGLLAIVGSEDELAGVLSHELGHIVREHSERQQRRSLWRGLGVAAVALITGSERLTNFAGQAAGFFTLRYSRKQEYEADDLGLTYLRGAGYDPYAAADMLSAIGRQERFHASRRGVEDAVAIPEWARTHPLTENRIARAVEAARSTGVADGAFPEKEEPYLREVDGLLYGDDPQQGFVIGRRFAHPRMGVAFEAPDGFALSNTPQAVLIDGPGGLRGEFAGGRLPEGGLQAYVDALLRNALGNAPAQVGEPQRLTVNNIPALFLPVLVQTPDGPASLFIAAYAAREHEAYHFMLVSDPAQRAAGEALFRSFRLLTPKQVESLRPRTISVVAVRAGDTVQSMAARIDDDDPVDLFLMLNGRSSDQSLRPGELVKLVRHAQR